MFLYLDGCKAISHHIITALERFNIFFAIWKLGFNKGILPLLFGLVYNMRTMLAQYYYLYDLARCQCLLFFYKNNQPVM